MSEGPAVLLARRALLAQIESGRLRLGDKLGSERDLANTIGVSRSSLRQSLALLEQSGVVRRVPGRGGGTFISHAKVDRDLSRVIGVPQLLRAQGFTAGTRVLSTSLVSADAATATALTLGVDELVFDIVRIRLADSVPISLEHVRLPAQRFAGLLEHPLGGSLYDLLADEYGVAPGQASECIEVTPASETQAAILEIESGAPLLSIDRCTTDTRGVAFEFSHDLFRADRTRILVDSSASGVQITHPNIR